MSPLTSEQRGEIAEAFATNRRAQEALSAAQRKREGGVELLLERSSDDPQENAPVFQEELSGFTKALGATGASYSQHAIAFDAIDGGGYPLAQFAIVIGPPAIAAAAAVCGAWVQARYGRKVRLKIGDVEAEGRTIKEIESLLVRAAEFQNATRTKSDDT